jgi:hypothetical protein
VSCAAGFAAPSCSGTVDAVDEGAASGFEGVVAPAPTRSSLLGGWTTSFVIIIPHANPRPIAAKTVPTPAK